MIKIVSIFTLLILSSFLVNGQTNNVDSGHEFAKKELERVLTNEKKKRSYVRKNPLIKDDEMAIKVVEPILFGRYGQEVIELQKPYKVYKIDQYYVINGTLPKGYIGGVFVIIIDEKNARVLDITHYK